MNNKLNYNLYDLNINDIDNLLGIEDTQYTEETFENYTKSVIEKEIQIRQLKNNGKNSLFDSDEILNIILKIFKPKYKIDYSSDDSFNVSYYVRNYNYKLPIYRLLDIEEIIVSISENIKIKDINKTTRDVAIRLKKRTKTKLQTLDELNLPPAHIILMPNGVLNLKTMEFSKNINEFGKFDFLNILSFNMPTEQSVNKLYLEIVKRIFNDWSDNKDDHLLYLKQLCFASIEGNGKGVYNILKAGGGNGKSTFLHILEELAGSRYSIQLDLHNLMDDNALTKMSLSNKLLVGHDLATNTKLSSRALSRFKELTTGEPFQVNVKYKDNILIQSFGLKIQSTNSDISFFENTSAIRRRLNIFSWTETKFHEQNLENKLDANLDKLVGNFGKPDKEFYEALIYFILSDMEYFDKFSVPQSAIDNTDKMVNEADNVYQFLNYIKDMGIDTGKLLTKHLYQIYKYWNITLGSGSKALGPKQFNERIRSLMNTFNFTYLLDNSNDLARTRASVFNDLEFNGDILSNYYFNNKIEFDRRGQSHAIVWENQISDENLKDFRDKLEKNLGSNDMNQDDMNYRELLMLHHEIKNGNVNAKLIF